MKNVAAKSSVILSMMFIIISICGMSNVDCVRGLTPIQQVIIFNNTMITGIISGDIKMLSYKLIPLFYIALVFIIISGILYFDKDNKIKGGVVLILSFVPVVYVILRHNYISFMIFLNIYLLLHVIFVNVKSPAFS